MAISAGAIWRVRIGGSNTLCSGLFDPTIAGAGTDYTEQDTAQLALTDLASATPYTTITSATGGFTAAMIGNGIYIASGTGFTAGRYVITAVTNTNTAVIDRACAASAASGGVAKVGGALATLIGISTSAPYSAVAGNTVLIRGQGLNDPVDIDYPTSGLIANAEFTYIGYNGRPKVGHNGALFNGSNGVHLVNFSFVQTGGTYTNLGVITSGGASLAENCVFDQSGFDAIQATNVSLLNCSFVNTGAQTLGTQPSIKITNVVSCFIKNTLIKDQRATGVLLDAYLSYISDSIIQNCSSNGIEITATTGLYSASIGMQNCTIYGNVGHGVVINKPYMSMKNNVIAAHSTAGKHGLYWSAAPSGYAREYARTSRSNFYGNNSNSNEPLSSLDTTIDPQFANAPVDLTPTNTALRIIGGVGAL